MLDQQQHVDALKVATSALVSDALDRVDPGPHTLDERIRPLATSGTLVGRAVPIIVVASHDVPEHPYINEMRAIDALEPGDVPVYVAAPDVHAAIFGELFSCAAMARGAAGAIVDGPIRDSHQIRELAFPVFARAWSPLDTLGRAVVDAFNVDAICGGVPVAPGDYVVADEDGIVVVPAAVVPDVAELVTAKGRKERDAHSDLVNGASIFDVWERYGVL